MGIDNRIVGTTIAELRKRAKMTQLQLAYTLNVSHQAVSKWESGSALPDIQTLLSLTQLFGVTMEQLLSGDIPRPQPEEEPQPQESEPQNSSPLNKWIQDNIPEEARKTISDLTRNARRTASDLAAKVGNAINTYASEITSSVSETPADEEAPVSEEDPQEPETEEPQEDEDDGTFTVIVEEDDDEDDEDDDDDDDEDDEDDEDEDDEDDDEAEEESALGGMTLEQLKQFAPFMSRAKLSEIAVTLYKQANWDTLTALAPFLSRSAIDELAGKLIISSPAGRAVLVRLAPFVSKSTLYALILANLSELSFNDLRAFCPFLGREMVDELFAYFTAGTVPKGAQKKTEPKPAVDVGSMLQQGLNGLGGVLNGIGNAVTGTIDSLRGKGKEAAPAPQPPKPARAPSEFKDRVARAALKDGNWDWLLNHYTEIGSQDILLEVAVAAVQPENRARTESMIPVLAQLLKEDKLAAYFEALASNANWELIASLRDYANEAAADAVVRCACENGSENAYTVIELFAAKMSPALLEELAEKALAESNWLLINALTDGQDRI